MVLVVARSRVDVDEVALDGALYAARHVVVERGKADGHADGFVEPEHGAVWTLRLGIVEIDAGDIDLVVGHVGGEDAVETVFAEGAGGAVARLVSLGLRTEDFFS